MTYRPNSFHILKSEELIDVTNLLVGDSQTSFTAVDLSAHVPSGMDWILALISGRGQSGEPDSSLLARPQGSTETDASLLLVSRWPEAATGLDRERLQRSWFRINPSNMQVEMRHTASGGKEAKRFIIWGWGKS